MSTFEEWLKQFQRYLRLSGIPESQVRKYDVGAVYEVDAKRYFDKGMSPGDAVTRELMP